MMKEQATEDSHRGVRMMRKIVPAIATLGMLFAVTAAGASVLDLTGSDSAPGSGKTEAACAGPLIVTNPVEQNGHDNNTIVHVDVDGDMTNCVGQTILVEVDLDNKGVAHAYAVRQFTVPTSQETFTFNLTTGDFYDTAPTPLNGSLTPNGTRLAPIKAKDFGLVTLTIAQTWK